MPLHDREVAAVAARAQHPRDSATLATARALRMEALTPRHRRFKSDACKLKPEVESYRASKLTMGTLKALGVAVLGLIGLALLLVFYTLAEPALRWISGVWFLVVLALGLLISVLAAIGCTFDKLSGRSKTPAQVLAQTRARNEREHRRQEWSQRSALEKLLWWFVRVWVGLVAFVNLAAIAGSFIGARTVVEGAARVQDTYDPFNLGTVIINLVLLLPAFGAYGWFERIERRRLRRRVTVS